MKITAMNQCYFQNDSGGQPRTLFGDTLDGPTKRHYVEHASSLGADVGVVFYTVAGRPEQLLVTSAAVPPGTAAVIGQWLWSHSSHMMFVHMSILWPGQVAWL